MENPKQEAEKEIDIEKFFKAIFNTVNGLINWLVSLIDKIGYSLINILIFFRIHAIKFIIVIGSGLIIGVILDSFKEPVYKSTMVVKPNYKSNQSLYKNVDFYNELVKQKKYKVLSQLFNIEDRDAESLVRFSIGPIVTDNDLFKQYTIFMETVDSIKRSGISFEDFKENANDYSYPYQEITVLSKKNDVFLKLEKTLLSGVSNSYFEGVRNAELSIVARNEMFVKQSLGKLDSLRKVYYQVLLSSTKKTNGDETNINLGPSIESKRELQLLEQEWLMNSKLDDLLRTKITSSKVVNLVSGFQKFGVEYKNIFSLKAFLLPCIGFTLTLLYLLGIKVNSFLLNQIKNRNQS